MLTHDWAMTTKYSLSPCASIDFLSSFIRLSLSLCLSFTYPLSRSPSLFQASLPFYYCLPRTANGILSSKDTLPPRVRKQQCMFWYCRNVTTVSCPYLSKSLINEFSKVCPRGLRDFLCVLYAKQLHMQVQTQSTVCVNTRMFTKRLTLNTRRASGVTNWWAVGWHLSVLGKCEQ